MHGFQKHMAGVGEGGGGLGGIERLTGGQYSFG